MFIKVGTRVFTKKNTRIPSLDDWIVRSSQIGWTKMNGLDCDCTSFTTMKLHLKYSFNGHMFWQTQLEIPKVEKTFFRLRSNCYKTFVKDSMYFVVLRSIIKRNRMCDKPIDFDTNHSSSCPKYVFRAQTNVSLWNNVMHKYDGKWLNMRRGLHCHELFRVMVYLPVWTLPRKCLQIAWTFQFHSLGGPSQIRHQEQIHQFEH